MSLKLRISQLSSDALMMALHILILDDVIGASKRENAYDTQDVFGRKDATLGSSPRVKHLAAIV